jgi:hypothetical protein
VSNRFYTKTIATADFNNEIIALKICRWSPPGAGDDKEAKEVVLELTETA